MTKMANVMTLSKAQVEALHKLMSTKIGASADELIKEYGVDEGLRLYQLKDRIARAAAKE
jgi:hypothetical protein